MKKLPDRIILILNIVASALLLLAYLAPVINPSKIILPALLGLAYPFLLIANLLFLCYWLIRLKKEILIPAIVILLGWNHLANLLPLNFRASEIPENVSPGRIFKVLSYNVRGFDIYHWTGNSQIKGEIMDFIEQQDPDILCFQEYYTSNRSGDTHGDILDQLHFLPEHAVYYTADQSNRNGFGIATYSKHRIIKKSRIPFNTSFNAAMYTDVVILSDTMRVFNVHLQSIRFRKEDYAFMDTVRFKYSNEQMRGLRNIRSQLKQAYTLRAEQADMIANYIQNSPYPVVVLGDFNDTPQSFAYRKIKKGMHDAFRVSGRGFGNTYAGDLPSFRIDFIIYNNPLISYQFKRIKNRLSDHYPITTWFYLPEAVDD